MLRSTVPTGEERRGLTFDDAGVQIRDDASGAARFNGYASVFNTRTAIGNPLTWGFYEEVADGAFTKTLSEGDARMLIDHDSYYVVSRVSAGTLFLSQDQRGLLTDSALNDDLSYVRDFKTNVQVRNITGMSFGFMVTKDDWVDEDVSTSDGNTASVEVRTIREVKLIEVSGVTFPAYEETTAGLRHSIVPALLRRGDDAAIARAAKHRPDLAELLGYDPDLARTIVDLKPAADTTVSVHLDGKAVREMTAKEIDRAGALIGEALGNDTPIAPTGLQLQPGEDASEGEPAETTRTADEEVTEEVTEPAASTRVAPSEAELAKNRLAALKAQLRNQAA